MEQTKYKKIRTRGHKVILNRSAGGDVGITIVLAIMGLFMFLPMYYVVIQSFKPLDELFMFPPRFLVMKPTFANFKDLFTLMGDSWVPFSRYIFNTVFITACGTVGNLLLASMTAYALSKLRFPGRNFMFQLIVMSLMFHSTVNQVTHFIILSSFGLVDNYLAIILPALASTLGLYLMKQFMEAYVSDAVLESARLDGASEFRIYWSIAMPMVKPAWLTLMIFSFQSLWVYTGGGFVFSEELKTLPAVIAGISAAGAVRVGVTAAAALLMMIPPVALFIGSQSRIIETMSTSGLK